MEVDEAALDEDFSDFLGDLFAGKGDFSFLGEVDGELSGMSDRFLDELFEGGEFD